MKPRPLNLAKEIFIIGFIGGLGFQVATWLIDWIFIKLGFALG